MNTLHVKTGDTVVVLSGKDKGKQGKIISASPKKGTVLVEGVAITAHHQKPRTQGETGGIVERETPIRACKVMRPSAANPPAPPTSLPTAKRSPSARSAALRSKEKEEVKHG